MFFTLSVYSFDRYVVYDSAAAFTFYLSFLTGKRMMKTVRDQYGSNSSGTGLRVQDPFGRDLCCAWKTVFTSAFAARRIAFVLVGDDPRSASRLPVAVWIRRRSSVRNVSSERDGKAGFTRRHLRNEITVRQ